MSFFQKLYEGEYAPINKETPETAEYKEQWELMSHAEQELRQLLNEEQRKLFEAYQQAQLKIENMLHIQAFEQGFYIGAEFKKDYKGIDHLQD